MLNENSRTNTPRATVSRPANEESAIPSHDERHGRANESRTGKDSDSVRSSGSGRLAEVVPLNVGPVSRTIHEDLAQRFEELEFSYCMLLDALALIMLDHFTDEGVRKYIKEVYQTRMPEQLVKDIRESLNHQKAESA